MLTVFSLLAVLSWIDLENIFNAPGVVTSSAGYADFFANQQMIGLILGGTIFLPMTPGMAIGQARGKDRALFQKYRAIIHNSCQKTSYLPSP